MQLAEFPGIQRPIIIASFNSQRVSTYIDFRCGVVADSIQRSAAFGFFSQFVTDHCGY